MNQRGLVIAAVVVAIVAALLLLSQKKDDPAPSGSPAQDAGDEPSGPQPELAGHQPEPSHTKPEPSTQPSQEAPQPREPEETEPEPEDVLVRVLKEDGAPVEGVTIVELLPVAPGSPGPYTRSLGTTDSDGKFLFTPPARRISLGVDPASTWHCDERYTLPDDRDRLVFHVVSNITLRGTVLAEDGTPAEGAHVLVRYRVRSEEGTTKTMFTRPEPTGPDGKFEVAVPAYAQEVTLSVRHEGAMASLTVNPRTSATPTLRLVKPVRISGVVVGPEGEPIKEPRVIAIPIDGGEVIKGGIQRGTNRFLVSAPRAGRYLLVLKPERGSVFRSPVPLEVEAPTEGLRIVAPQGLRLKGHVLGTNTSGFWVNWRRKRGADPRTTVKHRTRVDAQGDFVLEGLSDGATLLYLFNPDDDRFGLAERVRVPDDDLKVALKKGLSVKGSVPGYAGRKGFDLWIGVTWRGPERWTQVQEDGSFVLRGLPPGSYALSWQSAGKKIALDRTVEAGAPAIEVRVPGFGDSEGK
jgi:hypothetical protein